MIFRNARFERPDMVVVDQGADGLTAGATFVMNISSVVSTGKPEQSTAKGAPSTALFTMATLTDSNGNMIRTGPL